MSRPKLDLVSPPFHGHLHPIAGIAEALRDVADVRILSTPDALPALQSRGFETFPVLREHVAAVWRIANTPAAVRSRPWMMWRQFRANLLLQPALRADICAAWRERRPDVAMVDFTLPVVGLDAQAAGIRWWTSHPSPLAIETPDGTPSYLGGWQPQRTWLGRSRDWTGRRLTSWFKRAIFAANASLARAVGVTSVYRPDGTERVYSDELVLALGARELEFPATWPRSVRFVGPVLGTPVGAGGARVDRDPARRNVLVTIGTHLPHARAAFGERLRAWAEACPDIAFHYSAGGIALPTEAARAVPNLRTYHYLPYAENMPAFDAAIHHAGAGITYHCLAAGLPAVMLPQDYDQFDFAARLEFHGLGRRCRRLKTLPDLLRSVLADAALRDRVCAFGATLRGYDLRGHLLAALEAPSTEPVAASHR